VYIHGVSAYSEGLWNPGGAHVLAYSVSSPIQVADQGSKAVISRRDEFRSLYHPGVEHPEHL